LGIAMRTIPQWRMTPSSGNKDGSSAHCYVFDWSLRIVTTLHTHTHTHTQTHTHAPQYHCALVGGAGFPCIDPHLPRDVHTIWISFPKALALHLPVLCHYMGPIDI